MFKKSDAGAANAIEGSEKSTTQLRYSPELHTEEFKQEVESHKVLLRGRSLTWAIAFVTGTGFTLFGYASPHLTSRKPQH
jgi:hypothetical protein